MRKRKSPSLAGAHWPRLLGLAMLAFPIAVFAQSPPTTEKPPVEKKGDDAAQKQKDLAEKKAEQLRQARDKRLKARSAAKNPRAGAKPGKAGQVPAPTVELKPGEMPGIKFDLTTYDFGRIRAGGDVIHDFWFSNTGNGPLEILRVKPG